jgi:hypothetical protein
MSAFSGVTLADLFDCLFGESNCGKLRPSWTGATCRRVRARRLPFLSPLSVQYYDLFRESRKDLNPIAVSLPRRRRLRLECACVESRCDGRGQRSVQRYGNVTMRRAILLSAAVASATAAFAFASGPAQASGDIVSVKGSYTPGTIVIRTGERRLYYFVGAGEAIRR